MIPPRLTTPPHQLRSGPQHRRGNILGRHVLLPATWGIDLSREIDMPRKFFLQATVTAAVALAASAALAAPGDVYKVTSERVNLRAGPSDQSAVRSQVLQGDDVIELTQQGRWLGVRHARTGEEGWVYGDLVRRVSQSTLGRRVSAAGFGKYSRDFDSLIETINGELGYPMVATIDQGPNNTLRVTPTTEWMLGTGRDAKLYAAAALHQMWRNVTGRPGNVALMYGSTPFITVNDGNAGPVMAYEVPATALSGSVR
jgi:uncharacterized protein YraI